MSQPTSEQSEPESESNPALSKTDQELIAIAEEQKKSGFFNLGGESEGGSVVERKTPMSKTTLTVISALLGVVISVGVVISSLGHAFYVTRDEYNNKLMHDAETEAVVTQTLSRLEHTLARQEAAFDRMLDTVQVIKVEMAGRR